MTAARPQVGGDGDGPQGLEQSLGYLLNRAANMIAARFNDDLRPHDLSLQSWRVMAALHGQDPQSLTDLSDHTAAELSYLSRSVASAEARGLLARRPSPCDRRAVLLSLTPTGGVLLDELLPRRDEIEAAALSGISASDIRTTFDTLRAIYANLVDAPCRSSAVNRKVTVARRVRKRGAAASVPVPLPGTAVES